MKKLFLLSLSILFFWGCSQKAWLAKIYMVKAEEAFSKAHAMRVRKDGAAHSQRQQYYQVACDNFSRAYRWNSGTFTLNRIEEASEACLRVGDAKNEQTFREFEDEYIKNHPDEAKYGDAGAYMNMEG